MRVENLFTDTVGDMAVRYRLDRRSGKVELNLFPADMLPESSSGEDVSDLSPLASIKLEEDNSCTGFGCGGTMRYSETMSKLAFAKQEKEQNAIVTRFRTPTGVKLEHRLFWKEHVPVFFSEVKLTNDSSEPVRVELLESFSIGGIGEELDNDDFSRLICHRFRSRWCSEAFHENFPVWSCQLERYPSNHVIRNERFGQTGTMPVRKFHPFAAVEDKKSGVLWGAYLSWNASWQMELSMRNARGLTISGGLADREFGNWVCRLSPGETLTAPRAILCCTRGNLDTLTARMVKGIESTLDLPESEENLPVIFNEWCTTWGVPSQENMRKIAGRLKSLPVKYLVMDAGWFLREGDTSWASGQGDWIANPRLFPEGISAASDMIRRSGLIPGIWFEAEVSGCNSDSFRQDLEHFVHRDGRAVTVGSRRFWNHGDPEAEKILNRRVIRFLKENRFGYVKIDYNETLGIGCDHPDSPGEGIRQQGLGTYRFFQALRKAIPELVIENCASGGHRLEPGMFSVSSMSSFSDAHELDTIPVIAASLHRLMPPKQMQIWAVMRSEASPVRIVYLLTAAMLGRICLSGDILALSEEQMRLIRKALDFYKIVIPVLKSGNSCLQHLTDPRRSILNGGQILCRTSDTGKEVLVYFHAFHAFPQTLEASLPDANWKISGMFPETERDSVSVAGRGLLWHPTKEMSGCVVHLIHRDADSCSFVNITEKNKRNCQPDRRPL